MNMNNIIGSGNATCRAGALPHEVVHVHEPGLQAASREVGYRRPHLPTLIPGPV